MKLGMRRSNIFNQNSRSSRERKKTNIISEEICWNVSRMEG